MEDPLRELVVDQEKVAREALAGALQPYVRFTGEGDILLEPGFDRLPALKRVMCLLLAFKAAAMIGLRERPGVTPIELVEASGMPGGTVRPKLSALRDERVVIVTDGEYSLAPHAMNRVAREIAGEATVSLRREAP